jgi:penicillin-binding protein 1A
MKTIFKISLLLFLVISAVVLSGGFLWVRHEAKPFVAQLNKLEPFLNPVVLHAADGTVVGHLRPFQGRLVDRNDWVELDEVNPFLINALVALEDGRSDFHPGIDPIGVIRAILNTLYGHREGASTLESQVMRNVFDGLYDPYGTGKPFPKLPGLGEGGFGEYRRKALELYLAVAFHQRFDQAGKGKQKVKLAYLNICHFAPERRGVAYAARYYLGKESIALSDPEAILLARSPQRPVILHDVEKWKSVVENAVRDLARNDYINAPDTYELHPSFEFGRGPAIGGKPAVRSNAYLYHAVREAAWALRELQREGRPVLVPGNHVYLTINPEIQKCVYDAILGHVPYGAEAAVVVSDREGNIIALVGGRSSHGSCRATTVWYRGLDSTLKSFIALAAIESGALTLKSRVKDEPLAGQWPRNIGRGWRGSVSIKDAFGPSLNPWAVEYGIKAEADLFEILTRLGIPCPESRVELLGCGQGTTLLNLTAAYSIFLTNGFKPSPGIVGSVTDSDGKPVWGKTPVFLHIASGSTTEKVAVLLEDAVESPRGTAHALDGLVGEPLLAKTGSSRSQKRLQILLPKSGLSIGIHVLADSGDLPAGAETSAVRIAKDFVPRVAAGSRQKQELVKR